VYKVNEGRPNIVDLVKTGKVDMVINTPLGRESFYDEKSIRRAAIRYNIPCITTLSAANAAARLREGGPDGVVLTSTVTLSSSGAAQTSVYNTDLAAIRVPVLILSHRSDGCPVTPMHASEELVAKLTGAPAVDFRTVSGGKPPESGACAPYSPHGYFGVEQQATSIIIPWMKAHEPPR